MKELRVRRFLKWICKKSHPGFHGAVEREAFVVACVPAFNEERTIGGIVARILRYVDSVVMCDDGTVDLKGAIAGGLPLGEVF